MVVGGEGWENTMSEDGKLEGLVNEAACLTDTCVCIKRIMLRLGSNSKRQRDDLFFERENETKGVSSVRPLHE